MNSGKTLVVGLGEVGGALAEVLSRSEAVLRHDLEPMEFDDPIGVMHLCFPFTDPARFQTSALDYIAKFRPELTVINSTVLPGTTRALAERGGGAVAYSPVRGKHAKMVQDLRHYFKFVAAPDPQTAGLAEEHFQRAGLKTRRMNQIETLELAKLCETTYFGVLIAFAQEVNRYCERLGGDYYEASQFFEEIDFLPRCRYFPGIIGGHCVLPNIDLMLHVASAPLLEAVLESNQRRIQELDHDAADKRPAGTNGNGAMLANR